MSSIITSDDVPDNILPLLNFKIQCSNRTLLAIKTIRPVKRRGSSAGGDERVARSLTAQTNVCHLLMRHGFVSGFVLTVCGTFLFGFAQGKSLVCDLSNVCDAVSII